MNLIQAGEISKSYGEVVALSRFDMNVPQGSLCGFVGPNGAGKSTMIRILTGLTRPDNGIATVFGEKPYDNIDVKRRIGFVSEHDDLYPWATVQESIRMLTKLTMPHSTNLTSKIDEAIAIVGMKNYRDRKISALSKGMKQRTKIAAALPHDPELLILDEPLSGLDPLGRRLIMELLMDLNKEKGVTVLISSHILEELEDLINRVTLIHRGQTMAEGSPEKIRSLLYQYPHEIRFKAKTSDVRIIASKLVEVEGLIRSLNITENDDIAECSVITPLPERFFDELVKNAVAHNAPILRLETVSESVERLFEFLVR